MKTLKIVAILGIVLLFGRHAIQKREDSSAVEIKSKESLKLARSAAPTMARSRQHIEVADMQNSKTPSFEDWRIIYRNSEDDVLSKRFQEINTEIDGGGLITKMNIGTASEIERRNLLMLLREQNALSALQMERLSEHLKRENQL